MRRENIQNDFGYEDEICVAPYNNSMDSKTIYVAQFEWGYVAASFEFSCQLMEINYTKDEDFERMNNLMMTLDKHW